MLINISRKTSPAILCFISLLIALGCQEKTTQNKTVPAPAYTPAVAQTVASATSGLIDANESIKVRFVNPAAKDNQVGQSLKKPVFTFTPPIIGIARWKDRYTLVFTPNTPLPLRQSYQATLDLSPFAGTALAPLPFDFSFTVAGRELASLDGDFVLIDPNNPGALRYEAKLVFNAVTSLDTLKKATTLTQNRAALAKAAVQKSLPLAWMAGDDGRTFTFSSPIIHRIEQADANLNFTLTVNAALLGLSTDFKQGALLPPLRRMQIIEIRQDTDSETPRLMVKFSDELDHGQSLEGLLTVDDVAATRVQAMGAEATIEGAFAHGQPYTLRINRGIRSRWGSRSKADSLHRFAFADLKPQIRFASDGAFMPSTHAKKLRFMSLNVQKVELEIKKVFESNLGQFLQTEALASGDQRRDQFHNHYVNRVGLVIATDSLIIGDQRNRWLQHELDLSGLIANDEKGLFLLSLKFSKEDILYGSPAQAEDARTRRFPGTAYYSNPFSPGYYYTNGQIYKPIILSDIGLTYKQAGNRHLLYATRLADATPLPGAQITLRTYQNQIIAQATTDVDGRADFAKISKNEEVFYVEAQADSQRAFISLNAMAWDLSSFATEGHTWADDGSRAFIYTERGVYRPGDAINLSVIARHPNDTFPDDHPVTLKVFNPRNQPVFQLTQHQAREGFYQFTFQTRPQAPTGTWRAEALVGSQTFTHLLKIETVVPQRLKVTIEPDPQGLTAAEKILRFETGADYLFGTPGANLKAEVDLVLESAPKTFEEFPGFSFTHEGLEFTALETQLFNGQLNAKGRTQIEWPLPALSGVPSAMQAIIRTKVLEKGGRPNQRRVALKIDPYTRYVGFNKPKFDYGYARLGTPLEIPVVLADATGKAVAGQPLRYRLYHSERYWWWEYDNRDEFQLRFKSDRRTQLVHEGTIVSRETPVRLTCPLEERGQYLLEIADEETQGHTAGFFVRAYNWGNAPTGGDAGGDAGGLVLHADKKIYAPGDEAIVRFPSPQQGRALIAIEQGDRVLQSYWLPLEGDSGETQVRIPITTAMIPNAYVSVSLLQPHQQTANDRPLRLYGVIPLQVEDPATRQQIRITAAATLKPEAPFQITLQTADNQPTQFTLAVVDEGLLALTDFSTPNPWQAFYRKVRLGVRTFDLFSHVIGAHKGDVFRTFAIGGGFDDYRDGQLGRERRRFEPVSLFAGPLTTDAQGQATVDFVMPNYVGAVRIMAVHAQGRRYGHAEQTVPVKSDLMLLPTLPRALGPGDRFSLPISIFATKDSIGPVAVSVDVQGPLLIDGATQQTLDLPTAGEQELHFNLSAAEAVGTATVNISATGNGVTAQRQIFIEVRPSAPREYSRQDTRLSTDQNARFNIPAVGLPGTAKARISIQRGPNLHFSHRIDRLVRYPYGCIEQTTSAVFPQLYLRDVLAGSAQAQAVSQGEIDEHINAGIQRLRRFQLPDGSFSYWPGNSNPSLWGTNYAGHFLLEAQALGFHVPEDLLAQWVRYQKSQSLISRDALLVRTYRVFLLALAGESPVGALNLLKENHLKEMRDVEKWLLATAYHLAGIPQATESILSDTGMETRDYYETGGTYGSRLRDRAIILDALIRLERWDQAAPLADALALELSSHGWHSTQTTGFMLLALGKYLRAMELGADQQHILAGRILLPNGEPVDFSTEALGFELEIDTGFGQDIEITLDDRSTVKKPMAALEWEGVPLKSSASNENKNISLEVQWLNEDGNNMDPSRIRQGTAFWGHFHVKPLVDHGPIDEVALVQILPAGWEIENLRLSGDNTPGWMNRWNLKREEYLDLRDDRVMWFFDLQQRRQTLDFVVRLNAVTVGTFTLPPTLVEAMYNRDYRAVKVGGAVEVYK